MIKLAARLFTASAIFLLPVLAVAQQSPPPILSLGDATVTGFSGVTQPPQTQPPMSASQVLDKTMIDVDGVSARIVSLAFPGYVWDARVWPAQPVRTFAAKDIGQVFGVTLDDAQVQSAQGQSIQAPNIYFAASSAYGLHTVMPDPKRPGAFLRLKKGQKTAQWMTGMWGKADANGGPGSIWKVDGITAKVTLFANVTLGGKANSGAALGNIAFDAAHKQIFASDLSTGMIHRFDMTGAELEVYDHGVTGRTAAQLKPVAYDPALALDITAKDFDSEAPDTWGLTDEARRVWGLNVNDGRLYYAVVGDAQIWSVGLDKDSGKFLGDPRWELDVPKKPKKLPVTDIIFTHKGAMILAQRGEITSTYDYLGFADAGKARVYQHWLENPDDPKTPSRWILEPEEYAVGFDGNNRATNGGVALNYGYTQKGILDTGVCEASLWTTADNLRRNEPLSTALLPGGPQEIDGLQGMPAGVVKDKNTPPWASYMVDLDPANTETDPAQPMAYSDRVTQGWVGDLAIYRVGCGGAAGAGGGKGGSGGGGGAYGGAGYPWSYPHYGTNDGWDGKCTPGVDCPPPPPPMCAIPRGKFECDPKSGTWTYLLDANLDPNVKADTVQVGASSPGVSVLNGPMIALNPPPTPLQIGGAAPGQLISIQLCIFDKKASESGQPYDCCKTTLTVFAPDRVCTKQMQK